MCSLFAATYPEKTSALVMIGTYAKRIWDPDYPWAPTPKRARTSSTRSATTGAARSASKSARRASPPTRRSASGGAPTSAWAPAPARRLSLTQMNAEIDVRPVLPTIRVPTLDSPPHRRSLSAASKKAATSPERIPDARFVELPGEDHLPFVGDQDAMLDEIEEFLTGSRHRLELDRVLATVMCARVVACAGRDCARPRRRIRSSASTRTRARSSSGSGADASTRSRTGSSAPSTVRLAPSGARARISAAAPRFGVDVQDRTAHRRMRSSATTGSAASRSTPCAQVAAHAASGEVLVSQNREGSRRRLRPALRRSRQARARRRDRRMAAVRRRTRLSGKNVRIPCTSCRSNHS